MKLFTLEYWPVHVICIGMIAAAIIDWWKFKVPNKLTFPLILSGWLLGLCNNFGLEAGHGGIGAALAGHVSRHGPAAARLRHRRHGCRRRQNDHGLRLLDRRFFRHGPGHVDHRLCVLRRHDRRRRHRPGHDHGARQLSAKRRHVKEIVGDMFTAQGVGEIADKANRRRPRWHRLPYGVPLCIGFLGYLFYLGL